MHNKYRPVASTTHAILALHNVILHHGHQEKETDSCFLTAGLASQVQACFAKPESLASSDVIATSES